MPIALLMVLLYTLNPYLISYVVKVLIKDTLYLCLLSKFENKNFLYIIYKYWEIIDFKECS